MKFFGRKNEINVIAEKPFNSYEYFYGLNIDNNFKKFFNEYLHGSIHVYKDVNGTKKFTSIFVADTDSKNINEFYTGFSMDIFLFNLNVKLIEPITITRFTYFDQKIMITFKHEIR